MNIKRSYVYAKLPHAGLSNMLFVWAYAYVFSKINNLPLLVSSWIKPRIGPILRREKSKRYYFNTFKKPSVPEIMFGSVLNACVKKNTNPSISKIDESFGRSYLYVFDIIPHYSNYFEQLHPYKDEIKAALLSLLNDNIMNEFDKLEPPEIGIHMRKGDFQKLGHNEKPGDRGLIQLPNKYFIDIITSIRNHVGKELNVVVFTDAREDELQDFKNIPNLKISSQKKDILDLLWLSKSKIIVCSPTSTFSYWAAFLSDAIIIRHPAFGESRVNQTSIFEGSIAKFVSSTLKV